MNKVIMIVLDGLSCEVAYKTLGFMEHMVENKQCARYSVKTELPAMSRPLYEVLLTGVKPIESGIVNNMVNRLSKEKSIFHLAQENNLVTAASAYYWVCELYCKSPFDKINDRIILNSTTPINHGIYYYEDSYPDTHCFADGNYLVNTYNPDFLLVHSMNIDDIGHQYGGRSTELLRQAVKVDVILSTVIPLWLSKGYQIVVTSDHGMNEHHFHNMRNDVESLTPLYIFSDKIDKKDCVDEIIDQKEITSLLCKLLQIEKSEAMKECSIQ